MNVIVTGGAGFIGSHVVDRLLDDGHKVIVLDNFATGRRENLSHIIDKIQMVECDISLDGSWSEWFKDANWVIHLAALADIVPSIKYPKRYFDANVVGTLNVLRAATEVSVDKFIYSASSSCYGIPGVYPTPENEAMSPQYPYALTKKLGEDLVMHWAQIYKLPSISLRFFNVYGTRSRTSGTYGAVFGVFLAQKLAGQPLTIVGDGEQTRDFTYVSDVADAVVAAAESKITKEVLNIGSGKTVSVNTIAKLIGGETVHIPKRPGEPDCTFADIRKAKSILNWSPKIGIEAGVDRVLKNIEYWQEAPVWTPDNIAAETEDWFRLLSD